MSLKILIVGLEAIIPEDSNIATKISDSFFNSEKSDASYPMTLSLHQNRHIFGFIERVNARSKRYEYPASIHLGPYLILTGRCVVTDVSSTEIELFISNDKYSFWSGMKEKYLDELDLGTEMFLYHTAMITAFDESFTLGNKDFVVFPLYQNTEPLIINPISANEYRFTYSIGAPTDRFTPFVRLYKLLERIVSALGFTLENNSLLDDAGFADVILVCRRNTILRSDSTKSFSYNEFVPHIKVADFIAEIELRFSCLFITSINTQSVNIIKFTRNKKPIHLEVTDEIGKRFLEDDDIISGVEIKDKESDDIYVKEYEPRLIYQYGNQENAEKIECKSTIVGKKTYIVTINNLTLQWVCATMNENSYQQDEYRKKIDTEIRFTVFRPIESRLPAPGMVRFALFPSATPEPNPSAENDYNLLWKDVYNEDYNVPGLFNKYHKEKYDVVFSLLEEHSFIVYSDISILNKTNSILTDDLIIRNRRYRCTEQEIAMSPSGITGYIIKCHPI